MPTLDWIGKKAVVNHHRDVPYRLIHCDKDKSHGDPDAGNLLVQGDNLEALKALLPYYAGKVKCIYIDPPYNTGNESWVYNDNVNSPEIRAWLGSVVGKEAEDLSRHDKWLCMMYPRLRFMKDFLDYNGLIWISIDDSEQAYAKLLCDEIFGRMNCLGVISWEKSDSPKMDVEFFSSRHEYILCYAKNASDAELNRLISNEIAGHYELTDEHNRRYYLKPLRAMGGQGDSRAARPNLFYPLTAPNGEQVYPIRQDGTDGAWRWSVSKSKAELDRIEWKRTKGRWSPYFRIYADKANGRPSETIWFHKDVGSNRTSKLEVKKLFGDVNAFETPKPEALLQRILNISTNEGELVMDAFAGSGTFGAVAQKMRRHFVLIEIGEHVSTVVAPRLERVVDGTDRGGISEQTEWQGGGGFRYCTLGEPLFDADGNVSPTVTFPDLAAHVFFCETGSPIPKRADPASALIGTFQNRAIYLLHSPEAVGVASERAGNVLTGAVLESLPLPGPDFTGRRVVYAEGCTMPDERLSALGVTFKHIPYQIEGI